MNQPALSDRLKTELVDALSPALEGKKVLLGVTGSIAAFKACDIVRLLKQCGAQVRCVLTFSAQKFVTPLTLENLSGEAVYTSLWGDGAAGDEGAAPVSRGLGTHHIDAARWADVFVVAPATAHVIAKLAQGLADDLLSTELLAFRGPVLVAPAMNPAMYEHPAVQANVAMLKARGVAIVGPTQGRTACGEEGEGRMLEPEAVVEHIARAFYRPAASRRMLVTLGPTRSRLDPVRYLTNRSSGKMGAAIAWAARRAGYHVTVVAGPSDALLPADARVIRVETAREMLDAALAEFESANVFVSTAAVLDWDVVHPAADKLKKEDGAPALEFARAPDILGTLGARKRPDQYVLGFAAETRDALSSGVQKRLRKNCDALFANDVSLASRGFESRINGGWWISPGDVYELRAQPKSELADILVGLIDGRVPAGLVSASPLAVPHPGRDALPHPSTPPTDARIV
jgi:phosphopantothenoylcysteine decarboxylase/phosphopantothenate--cysteine ligase